MPELRVGERRWPVAIGRNLLDALLAAQVQVPHGCRAGSCHACLVRCIEGDVLDDLPGALAQHKHADGWRLACQCRIAGDLQLQVFDPSLDGIPARVQACDWLTDSVLRLRLLPLRSMRYLAGQHVVLWAVDGTARPYSLASVPGEDEFLEFHIECRHGGRFASAARGLVVGDELRIGELHGGALHYDPQWQERPLWLIAVGTGLAPLWGLLREARRQGHVGPVRLVHVAGEHYLERELRQMQADWPGLVVDLWPDAEAVDLRLVPRRTVALLCGAQSSVELFAKRLYLAGVPRNQVFADVFI
ncbi:iron-sulfur-binding ferredoxin reductase [Pseudomonas sp. LRF_L74]|uniref:iron-sulfur-binding ferredoxin reductase n=1 Tax=Pseudomonas sp. LRF_L74 TaxID=3369422 RepID=UPI003F603E93